MGIQRIKKLVISVILFFSRRKGKLLLRLQLTEGHYLRGIAASGIC